MWPPLGLGPLDLDWLLEPLPLYPHCSLNLLRSTCASVLPSFLYLGMVPTYLLGLEVAQGAPLGLAGLGLLGPAIAAGEPWPCDELVLVFLTREGAWPLASLAISSRLA